MPGSPRKLKPHRYSRADFAREFPDDDACLDWLWRHLYASDGEHAECPKCERVRKFHRDRTRSGRDGSQRRSYSCDTCGWHIHPTADTIFHKSTTPLRSWFLAIFLLSATRCGISAKQIERELSVTYKTAWRMANKIRKLLAEDGDPLGGEVEIDETFMGGKISNRHKSVDPRRGQRGGAGHPKDDPFRTPVLAMIERKGRVIARVVTDTRRETIFPHVREHVLPATMVYTDEWQAYKALEGEGYHHRRVNHSQGIYVAGAASTNTLEGFFSLVKRGISGVNHSISRKWLQDYLNEYAFRYNHRDDAAPMFKLFLANVSQVQA